MKSKFNFKFPNPVSPRYIQPLFLKLEHGIWYNSTDLRDILHLSFPNIDGKDIVYTNIVTWYLIGLGEYKVENFQGRKSFFKLSDLGKQLQETYSTNLELFFELMHFLFFSTWEKNKSPEVGLFWVYSQVCNKLWSNAPNPMDSFELTSLLQQEAQNEFIGYNPGFPERAIRAVYPWLASLTPAFLQKNLHNKAFTSARRPFCSPQLFHLALDLTYNEKKLKYGTSMAIGDGEIKKICMVCLLDEKQFWEMLDRTKMIIRGVEIRRGQFNTSIALEMGPQWINLPDYSIEAGYEFMNGDDV